MKNIITLAILLAFGALNAGAQTPLIDNPRQIKKGVIEAIVAPIYDPKFAAVGASTAALRSDLTAETAARISGDNALVSSLTVLSGSVDTRFSDVAVATEALRTDLNAVITSTGELQGQIDAIVAAPVVTKLIAGTNITLTPGTGVGDVTIDATAGGVGDAVLAGTQTFTGQNTFENVLTVKSASGMPYQQFVMRDTVDTSLGGNLGIYGLSGDSNFIVNNAYFDGSEWRISKNGGGTILAMNNASGSGENGGRFTVYISTEKTAGASFGATEILNLTGLVDDVGSTYAQAKIAGQIKSITTPFPQLVLEDSGDDRGIMSLGGVTGTASYVANNLYYDYNATEWKHSNSGGASLVMADVSSGGTQGRWRVLVSSVSGNADDNAQLRDVLTVSPANDGSVGINNSAPSYPLDVTGGMRASFAVLGYERVVNTCTSTTSCAASCTASKAPLGGSCKASPQVSPLDSELTAGGYSCAAGSSTDITAVVVCANIQ